MRIQAKTDVPLSPYISVYPHEACPCTGSALSWHTGHSLLQYTGILFSTSCFLGLGAQDIPIKTGTGKESNRFSGTKIYFCSYPCTHSFFCVLHVEFSATQTSVLFPGCTFIILCLNDSQLLRKQPKLLQFWKKTTKYHVGITLDENRIFAQKKLLLFLTDFGSDLLVPENKMSGFWRQKGTLRLTFVESLPKGCLQAKSWFSFSTYLNGSINDKVSSYKFSLSHVFWQFYH